MFVLHQNRYDLFLADPSAMPPKMTAPSKFSLLFLLLHSILHSSHSLLLSDLMLAIWMSYRLRPLSTPPPRSSALYLTLCGLCACLRDCGRGPKNCVHESMLPDWMDLVMWGHEHACEIAPREATYGRSHIIQPGSSVATSLVEGEAVPKMVRHHEENRGGNVHKWDPSIYTYTYYIRDVKLRLGHIYTCRYL